MSTPQSWSFDFLPSLNLDLNRFQKKKSPKLKKKNTADLAAGMEQLRLNPDAREFVPPSGSSAGAGGVSGYLHNQQQSYAMMLGGGGGASASASASSSGANGGGAHAAAAAAPSNGNGGSRANGGTGFFPHQQHHQQLHQQHFGGNGHNGGSHNGNGVASTSGHHHHHLYGGHHHHHHGGAFGGGLGGIPPPHQPDLSGPYRRGKGDARAKAVQRKKNSVQKALEEAGAVQRTVSIELICFFLLPFESRSSFFIFAHLSRLWGFVSLLNNKKKQHSRSTSATSTAP